MGIAKKKPGRFVASLKEGVGDVDESSRYETGPAVPCNFSGKIVICSLRRARLIVSREPKESTSVFLHLFSRRRRRMKNTDVRKRTRPMSTGLSLSPLSSLSLSPRLDYEGSIKIAREQRKRFDR